MATKNKQKQINTFEDYINDVAQEVLRTFPHLCQNLDHEKEFAYWQESKFVMLKRSQINKVISTIIKNSCESKTNKSGETIENTHNPTSSLISTIFNAMTTDIQIVSFNEFDVDYSFIAFNDGYIYKITSGRILKANPQKHKFFNFVACSSKQFKQRYDFPKSKTTKYLTDWGFAKKDQEALWQLWANGINGNPMQVGLCCYSDGGAGQSRLVAMLQNCFGNYTTTLSPTYIINSINEQHLTGLARLRNKRFVICGEMTDSNRHIKADLFKTLTSGGDSLAVRKMGADFGDDLLCKFLFITYGNNTPKFKKVDNSIIRRNVSWQFLKIFSEQEGEKSVDEIDGDILSEAPMIIQKVLKEATKQYKQNVTSFKKSVGFIKHSQEFIDEANAFKFAVIKAIRTGKLNKQQVATNIEVSEALAEVNYSVSPTEVSKQMKPAGFEATKKYVTQTGNKKKKQVRFWIINDHLMDYELDEDKDSKTDTNQIDQKDIPF